MFVINHCFLSTYVMRISYSNLTTTSDVSNKLRNETQHFFHLYWGLFHIYFPILFHYKVALENRIYNGVSICVYICN